MYDRLVNKEATLAVIGLGYVGLPIALEFARQIKVVGFDINAERVEMMRNKKDPSNELPAEAFEGCDITFTATIEDLSDVQTYRIYVRLLVRRKQWLKCCRKATMWCTNQPYTQAAPRKIASQYWKQVLA
jgi:UDP-N-acetyl-D-mannosaminuronate dehydrogenase